MLEEAGIDMVFGMPGGNVIALFDALYDHQVTIRTVLARDESLASVMAEAYGRLTGKPGVVIGVDDAHLLDELSATLVHQLVLRRAASVVLTLRSGEATPDAVTALPVVPVCQSVEDGLP